jgi:cytochrome c-type biogenesis protein CcmH/NrfF
MQSVGMSDEQIVQAFIREEGIAIYLAPPNAWGWIIPYAVVGLGMALCVLFVRKYYKPKVMTDLGEIEADDPELAKYKEQIEKDTANLD